MNEVNVDELNANGLDEFLRTRLRDWDIEEFTTVQQMALQAGAADGASLIVSAPTSSGKTLVAEIAVCKALQKGIRCIYLVSHKALADQKFIDFEKRFGSTAATQIASVGLSTGDREEGEASPQLLVATYEKALALLLSEQMDPRSALVVADELQIISEPVRGPNIETLCAILRQRHLYQFLALTATVGNPNELADWLQCDLVHCDNRDVELHQEIWSHGQGYSVTFGQEDGQRIHTQTPLPEATLDAVKHLISSGKGPVLVFTESRREAVDLANAFSSSLSRSAHGIELAEQLDLFSEPTEASEQLQANAQRGVAFHTADLTPQERQVVEQGFVEGKFDACFATSTLAAGVNFPFQSVVFPKLTYQWGPRGGNMISRPDYRNMSGRAGRLGMHEAGFSVLLPGNPRELQHANDLVLPANDNIASQLVTISMRRTILTLISSGAIATKSSIREFFENTFYWHQISEHNPKKLDDVIGKALESIVWLEGHNLIEGVGDTLLPSPLGKAVAQSGLLPTTAIAFLTTLKTHATQLDADFDSFMVGLIHLMCTSPEFQGDAPSRFLVYPTGRNPVASTDFLSSVNLLAPLDRTDNQTNQCVHALALYCNGDAERQIRYQTNISSGGVHRLAVDVAWVMDGLHRIASVVDLGYPQTLTNKIAMLARRIRWGAPAEALDIIRLAQRNGVPGFGRQRAMALLAQGLSTFEQILTTARDTLKAILRSEDRVQYFLQAITSSGAIAPDRYARVHQQVAGQIGLSDIVTACNDKLGIEYERAIEKLLSAETRWVVRAIDDGKQQNVPDLLLTLAGRSILIECKTTSKQPPLVKKEEAFAVLQKAVDFDEKMHRVTLGKPAFDEHSKKKVQAATNLSLAEHSMFIEGVLRVLTGSVSPEAFFDWLCEPGLAEIDRLSGASSMELLARQ